MDVSIFKEAVKSCGGKINFLNSGCYNQLATRISDEESILSACEGMDNNGPSAIVVTNKAVYGHIMTGLFANKQILIPLEKVTSVSSVGALSKTLKIAEGTAIHEVKGVSIKQANSISEAINKGLGTTSDGKAPQLSVADELRKFKGLLDDGIITQEEFDKKKSALLG